MSLQRASVVALAIGLIAAGGGCSRRRTVSYGAQRPSIATSVVATGLDAGLTRFDLPYYFAPRDTRTATEHGITTSTSTWDVAAGNVSMYVASLTRSAPFGGSRDQLLLDVLGDRVRQGALGQVTFEFQNGLLLAAALGQVSGQDTQVRAYLSRTRLVLVVCTGQAPSVRAAMDGIVPTPAPGELFYVPAQPGSDETPRAVWGYGFSCTMPGGVTHTESQERWTYVANDASHTYEVVHTFGDHTIEQLSADALARGTVLESTDDFLGGTRRRRVTTEVGGSWHAWQFAGAFTFHVSGSGPVTSDTRTAATTFFDSCVF